LGKCQNFKVSCYILRAIPKVFKCPAHSTVCKDLTQFLKFYLILVRSHTKREKKKKKTKKIKIKVGVLKNLLLRALHKFSNACPSCRKIMGYKAPSPTTLEISCKVFTFGK
jgi:hypothetical protein